jgi:hypothetical protein
MNDSTDKNTRVPPPWGDDAEIAMIERQNLLKNPMARRSRTRMVFVIGLTALLGVLLSFFCPYMPAAEAIAQ